MSDLLIIDSLLNHSHPRSVSDVSKESDTFPDICKCRDFSLTESRCYSADGEQKHHCEEENHFPDSLVDFATDITHATTRFVPYILSQSTCINRAPPNQIGWRHLVTWRKTIFLTISQLEAESVLVMLSCHGHSTCCLTNLIGGGGDGGKVELPSQTHNMHYVITLT